MLRQYDNDTEENIVFCIKYKFGYSTIINYNSLTDSFSHEMVFTKDSCGCVV